MPGPKHSADLAADPTASYGAVAREARSGAGAKQRWGHGEQAAALVRKWLEAPATADEQLWPEAAWALDEDRRSGRKLFL